MPAARLERAPAKVNLILHVIGRRGDGYHEIESIVAFANIGDMIAFTPGVELSLAIRGPTARAAGPVASNLVLGAARALAERIADLRLGSFVLSKRLPVAAGLGGGSADAAAALRLLSRANRIGRDDPRLLEAARIAGADVPVCLDPRARIMRGIGEVLSSPLELPRLAAVLANPGVAVSTAEVFAALKPQRCESTSRPARASAAAEVMARITGGRNDLEAPAVQLCPQIAEVLAALRALPRCRLARMSGSGATCFGLFPSASAARAAARGLRDAHPDWWVRATMLS